MTLYNFMYLEKSNFFIWFEAYKRMYIDILGFKIKYKRDIENIQPIMARLKTNNISVILICT